MEDIPQDSDAARIRAYFDEPPRRWERWAKGREYLLNERRGLLLSAYRLTAEPMHSLTVCDVGCGVGTDLGFWASKGVPATRLAGTELSPLRATGARARLPEAEIADVTGLSLPFENGRFALTSASLVFSLLRADRQRVELFSEMERVTRPGGVVVVYDFRFKNPGNNQVIALTDERVLRMARHWDKRWLAAPLLPILDAVLRLPQQIRQISRLLPKTHAMWVWQLPT